MDFTPGGALGASYRLVKKLGEGAVGTVWLIESTVNGELFAAKFLKPEHSDDPATVEHFVRERSVLLGLKHSNIVAVRDLVMEGSHIAIIMDYVPGGSLRNVLQEQQTLAPGAALGIMSHVFAGLAHAHQHNVTHRDIKPDNVLLNRPWDATPGGSAHKDAAHKVDVRVADFGIASAMTPSSQVTQGLLGTPEYMAPEVIQSGSWVPAGDIYSAGIMLYELLAGRTPYAGGGNDFTIAYRHTIHHPPQLELPEPLNDWLETLLSKNPHQRPTAVQAHHEAQKFAQEYADLEPLPPAATPKEYVAGQSTLLRAGMVDQRVIIPDFIDPAYSHEPELGPSHRPTMLRPTSQQPTPHHPTPQQPGSHHSASDHSAPQRSRRRRSRVKSSPSRRGFTAVILVGAVLVVGSVTAVVAVLNKGALFPGWDQDTTIKATQQDPPLPSGLITTREASYDPQTQELEIQYTYNAQKAQLSGSFLEVTPGRADLDEEGTCMTPTWQGVQAQKHQAASGLAAECGWQLQEITVPENGQFTFSASIPSGPLEESELQSWLETAATATAVALNNTEASSTAYPVQRLQDMEVLVPARTISQTTLPITIIPVWPNGPDELNPLYQSPATGEPTQLLRSISGNAEPVRFSDSCAGAVAVATDGLTVTTLTPAAECTIHATVGNFTTLQSEPFRITTRQ